MANVNDAHGMAAKVERAEYLLAGAYWLGDIAESDYRAIQKYIRHNRDNWSQTTTRDTLMTLRVSAARADKPLLAFGEVDDWNRLRDAHRAAGCESAAGLNSHVRAVRGLLQWADNDGPGQLGDYEFAEHIKYVTADDDEALVDPEAIPSENDLQAMREAVEHPRDKALLEFLADSGVRVALACQLQRRHVDMDSTPPTYRPNPDGVAQKGQPDREYPLKESAQFMRHWLNTYHDDDHPDAPVFRKVHGYNPEDRENGALSPRTVSGITKKAGEQAGLPDRTDTNPHAFRHLMVARGHLKHGLSWDRIQYRGGWSDRSMDKIRATYGRLTDEQKLDLLIEDLFGIPADDGTTEVADDETWRCDNCGQEVTARVDQCGSCGYNRRAPPEGAAAGLLNSALVDGDEDAIDRLAEVVAGHMSPEKIQEIYEQNAEDLPGDLTSRDD